MIVDSSALTAVLLAEPSRDALVSALEGAGGRAIGAPTAVETSIVLTARLGIEGHTLLEQMLRHAEIEIIPFIDRHRAVAAYAYERYGKGRHSAALNFGDCLTYAVARLAGRPLLCTGKDFVQTDLPLVEWR